MTDREWAIAIVRAWEATDSMDTSIDMVRTFRAEVLKEAEENTWNWLIGLSSDNFPMSREKLHSAILGDHVPDATKMTDCPACGLPWDTSRFNSCQCGAFLSERTSNDHSLRSEPLPPDILMDASQDKLHVDLTGRRPDAEKIGPAIQALLEKNHHGIDCPTCAESVEVERGCTTCVYKAVRLHDDPCKDCTHPDYPYWIEELNPKVPVCQQCAESVDGDPGSACCGQCREEDER